MDKQNIIRIRQPFVDQYTLLVESKTLAIDSDFRSKVRLRWNVEFYNIEEEYLECRLIKTEHSLLEKNNTIIDEVMAISELFGKIYNEVHVRINHKGKVLEVLNQEVIQSKWSQVKVELQNQLDESQVKDIFTLNDSVVNNPKMIKEAVQAQEFFSIYFTHVFDEELPYVKQSVPGVNVFNTANLLWTYEAKQTQSSNSQNNLETVRYKAYPTNRPKDGFYNAAYGQFKDKIDINNLYTRMNQQAEYTIDNDIGKLYDAIIIKEEIADENQLYSTIKYELQNDESLYKIQANVNTQNQNNTFSV